MLHLSLGRPANIFKVKQKRDNFGLKYMLWLRDNIF
jgi:hypothetical protein